MLRRKYSLNSLIRPAVWHVEDEEAAAGGGAAVVDAAPVVEDTQAGAGGAPVEDTGTPTSGAEGAEAKGLDPEAAEIAELRAAIAQYESGEVPAAAEPAKAEEPVKTAEEELAAVADAPVFTFTEGTDFDTFSKEAEAYLETVELDPAAETLVNRYKQEAEVARAEAAKASEVATTDTGLAKAFDQLVEFRKDEELQEFVPNTTDVITVLQKDFAGEMPQLIEDLNSLPSPKYPGQTRFQEYIRDAFDLDNEAMAKLDHFVRSGGSMPYPSYVPEGLNEQLAEAYWTAVNREEIGQQLAAAAYTLSGQDEEASAADKQTATETIRRINGQLAQIQGGINAQRQRAESEKQAQVAAQRKISDASVDRFIGVTRGIIETLATDATKGLAESLGADGAGLTGLSIANLVETAFSDNQEYAKYSQDQLAKYGITADWPAALATRDELFTAVQKVVYLEQVPSTNPRAIDNAKKDVDGVVKRLIGLAREAGGKINAKVVTSAGKKLEKDISKAPKQAFARPKASAAAAGSSATKPNYEEMPLEEIRSRLGEMLRTQRERGGG